MAITIAEARQIVTFLEAQRNEQDNDLKKIRDFIIPFRGNWPGSGENHNTTKEKGRKILNSSATQSLKRSAGGLTAAMTPDSMPWFNLGPSNKQMSEVTGVRWWFDQVQDIIYKMLQTGKFYQTIHTGNQEYIGFDNMLLYSESGGYDRLIRFECVTAGSYAVSMDDAGDLDTVVRRIRYTLKQIVKKYGEESLCNASKEKYKKNPYEFVQVIQIVRPNEGKKPGFMDNLNMAYESIVFEDLTDSDGKYQTPLSVSGYHEMPYFFASFDRPGNTVYGYGPGHMALGFAVALQEYERQMLIAIQKQVNPPMRKPSSLKNQRLNTSPGAENAVSVNEPHGVAPLYETGISLGDLKEKIAETKMELASILMADLFYDLPADMRPRDMTASEYMERKRERLQMMAPALAAYEPDVLDRIIERCYAIADRAGILPPLPPALAEGGAIDIEYVSIAAQALRQTNSETALALLQRVGEVARLQMEAQQAPTALDKIDFDQIVDEIGVGIGAPARTLRSDEEVEILRSQRAEAEAKAQEMQQMMQGAEAIAKIGAAGTGENTVAGDLMGKGE